MFTDVVVLAHKPAGPLPAIPAAVLTKTGVEIKILL
jgi:hypothetical protein